MNNSGHNYTFGMSLISKSRWDRAFGKTDTVSVEYSCLCGHCTMDKEYSDDRLEITFTNPGTTDCHVFLGKPDEAKPIWPRFSSKLPMTDEQIADMEVGIKKHAD